jgi:hypothetical protein
MVCRTEFYVGERVGERVVERVVERVGGRR